MVRAEVLQGDLLAMLEAAGELLPVRSVEGRPGDWLLHHCTTIFAALDLERSVVERTTVGSIHHAPAPVWRADLEQAVPPMFLQADCIGDPMFSGRGRDVVLASGATGLTFREAFWRPDFHNDRTHEQPVTIDEIMSLPPIELDARVGRRLSHIVDWTRAEATRAAGPLVAAYMATSGFEALYGNGGLTGYIGSTDDVDHFDLVVEGYSTLGLPEYGRRIREIVGPFVEALRAWRAAAPDEDVWDFFDTYDEGAFDEGTDAIGYFDDERVALVLVHPEAFAR